MTRPALARMTVTLPPATEPMIESVLVVTLGDGRLGFSATTAALEGLVDGGVLVLGPEGLTGTAAVVRSGTAYEEVRGRTRAAEGWLARWRRGHDDVVVLVVPLPP